MPESTTSSLAELLSGFDVAIDAGSVNEFRACLAGLATQLQDSGTGDQEAALQRSLQAWWQWFDDEGYARDVLATVLQRFVVARLGEQGCQALLAYSQAIADEPQGLPSLMGHLNETHPNLALEFELLERQALEDEQQLMDVAGGKGGVKGEVYGVLGVIAITSTWAAVHEYKKLKNLGELLPEVIQKEEYYAAKAREHERLAEADAEEWTARWLGHQAAPIFREMLPSLRSMDPAQRQAWFRTSRDTQAKGKLLHQFEENEIEDYCNHLAWEHYINHEEAIQGYVDTKVANNPELIDQIKQAIRNEDSYKELLEAYINRDNAFVVRAEDYYRNNLEASEWFQQMTQKTLEAYKNQELDGIRDKLYKTYKLNMELGVNAEKAKIANVADTDMNDYIERNLSKLNPERFGIDTKIHAATRDVETKLKRQAAAGIADLEAGGRDITRNL